MVAVMKTKDIKNGSLYYNTVKNRVERVISNRFSNTRVVTECHKRDALPVPSKTLRLASQQEVDSYLTSKPKRSILSFLFGRLNRTV